MPNLFASLRPLRWSFAAGVAVAATTLTDLSAFAAEGGEAKGGLPQLDPSVFARQIFWLVIAFLALLWLLSKRALPVVEEVLEKRRLTIQSDLDAAAKARDEAAAARAALEKASADARAVAHEHIAKILATADEAAHERQTRLGADLHARVTAAEQRVAAAKAEAIANIRSGAADIARDVVHKLAGVNAESSAIDSAVAAVLKERG